MVPKTLHLISAQPGYAAEQARRHVAIFGGVRVAAETARAVLCDSAVVPQHVDGRFHRVADVNSTIGVDSNVERISSLRRRPMNDLAIATHGLNVVTVARSAGRVDPADVDLHDGALRSCANPGRRHAEGGGN